MGVIRTGVLIAVIGMMSFLREKTCRWESRWPKMNPGGGPHEKSTTGNGAEPQRGCTDQRTGCRLGLERTGLGIGLEREIKVKKRKLHQRPEGEATKFCQGNEEERTGWSNEGFVFLCFFFQNKRDLFLKKLGERGRM